MSYKDFKKEMDKQNHGDGISLGAVLTAEFTLFGFLILSIFLILRIYGDLLLVLIGLLVIGLTYSLAPLIFKFQKENSNDIGNQMFWLSMFSGILAMVIYFAR
ncbi:conserved hypothetical protein [Methanococcus vannielii SB]|jgi:energy-converting hydrogenase B subunit G|uniref:Energy-converting hydrogenase B, subunit G n=1 Tax=Methanococcus vannielii (strain ATCC 35089 / DSM 1224 / JCM 13029 / OCM 148 / SB) TaxID=406327 RepID=A6UQR8_METVS|nr:hypothetical protein [Methanococcus vannielii]ABR54840.1 conserved hypothetical protein [Methanococcus vannielii SB]